jgi:hypothetical protein
MRRSALVVPFLTVLAAPASAASITYTVDLPLLGTQQTSATVSLPGFDPALGTLSAVGLTDFISYDWSVTWHNIDTKPWPFELGVSTVWFSLENAFVGLSVVGEDYHGPGTLSGGMLQPGDTVTRTFDEGTNPPFIFILFADITPWITSDLIPFTFGLDYGFTGNFVTDYAVQMTGGTMSVQYDYTPVPEPASLLLLGSGVGVLLFRRHMGRRKTTSTLTGVGAPRL